MERHLPKNQPSLPRIENLSVKQNQYLKSHKHSELKILKSATDCLSIKNKYNKSEMYGLETLDAQWAKLGKKYTIEGNWNPLNSKDKINFY